MKNNVLLILILAASLFLGGCRRPPKDVTRVPHYNFSSFAGTVWKTKVKVALTDVTEYNGEHHLTLYSTDAFAPPDPKYPRMNDRYPIISILPAGARIRIRRLWFDTGEAGLLWVTASLDSGTYYRKTVYVSRQMLANNIFLEHDPSFPKTWGVNPKYLESDAPPRKARGAGK
jgi:hypothetical protein